MFLLVSSATVALFLGSASADRRLKFFLLALLQEFLLLEEALLRTEFLLRPDIPSKIESLHDSDGSKEALAPASAMHFPLLVECKGVSVL